MWYNWGSLDRGRGTMKDNDSFEGYGRCPGRWRCPLPSLPWCTPLTICPLENGKQTSHTLSYRVKPHLQAAEMKDKRPRIRTETMWGSYGAIWWFRPALGGDAVAHSFNHIHFLTRFLPSLALESDSAFQVFFLASADQLISLHSCCFSSWLSQRMCSVEKDVDPRSQLADFQLTHS